MGCPGVDVQLGLDPGGEERQRVHDALVAKDVRSSDSYEGRRELAQIAGTQLSPAQKAYGGLGPDFFADRSWGFCQSVLDTGAYGWNGGFGSSWLVDPSCDLVVIVLTQRMFESADLPQVHPDIQAAAYAALS
ncbi:MAG TPA: serine hydrolase [Acidimicrobiales bacterium]|nr:serine hydrolase [Acidimicrobiales bacterium]